MLKVLQLLQVEILLVSASEWAHLLVRDRKPISLPVCNSMDEWPEHFIIGSLLRVIEVCSAIVAQLVTAVSVSQ
ncbi:TPA: hypothetical protein NIB55_006295 [Pseudomonas aeruginosa]|nr:hypothetical protein [Pseudomonas aeruginosa]